MPRFVYHGDEGLLAVAESGLGGKKRWTIGINKV